MTGNPILIAAAAAWFVIVTIACARRLYEEHKRQKSMRRPCARYAPTSMTQVPRKPA